MAYNVNTMNLDITVHKGDPDKPVVIFIHGLGVNKGFWTDPDTKVLARIIPLKVFAAKKPRPRAALSRGRVKYKKLTVGFIPEKTENLWSTVISHGFNAVCWSQSRPAGPIGAAVEELDKIVINATKLFPEKPVALIGHSRGGLVARKYMEKKPREIKALVTISSPHGGSSLSRLGTYLSPLAPALKRMLPGDTHGTVSVVLKNLNDLLEGSALKELLPGSSFLKNLKDPPINDVKYESFGGSRTRLLPLYSWQKQDDTIYPKALMTIPDSLLKLFPQSIIPEEITSGKGDFMVTTESSVLPWAQRHYNVSANHISISWHKKVIEKTLNVLNNI
jgi:pimeloyl-ACP methyl ester carboxylesterase